MFIVSVPKIKWSHLEERLCPFVLFPVARIALTQSQDTQIFVDCMKENFKSRKHMNKWIALFGLQVLGSFEDRLGICRIRPST